MSCNATASAAWWEPRECHKHRVSRRRHVDRAADGVARCRIQARIQRALTHALKSLSSLAPASPSVPPAAARLAREASSARAGHRTPPRGHAAGEPRTIAARVAYPLSWAWRMRRSRELPGRSAAAASRRRRSLFVRLRPSWACEGRSTAAAVRTNSCRQPEGARGRGLRLSLKAQGQLSHPRRRHEQPEVRHRRRQVLPYHRRQRPAAARGDERLLLLRRLGMAAARQASGWAVLGAQEPSATRACAWLLRP